MEVFIEHRQTIIALLFFHISHVWLMGVKFATMSNWFFLVIIECVWFLTFSIISRLQILIFRIYNYIYALENLFLRNLSKYDTHTRCLISSLKLWQLIYHQTLKPIIIVHLTTNYVEKNWVGPLCANINMYLEKFETNVLCIWHNGILLTR